MQRFRTALWSLLGLLVVLLPAAPAHAGVFISVGFAPPVLPVYVQPPCPEPNLIWSPGYWAYGDEGYYWVPGAWVPAPYEGALWTPPYWGWSGGFYAFHPGYWGREVGYYGGVNYGFGYMGVGFVGGAWHGHEFAYNTAVVNVNRTYIHNTYVNNTIVREHTVVNTNHIAYAGGPGGIQHQATLEERNAMQAPHLPPTRFQDQQMQQARTERTSYFTANHGRPQSMALARPLPAEHHEAPAGLGGTRGGMSQNPGVRGGMQATGNTEQNNSAHLNMTRPNEGPQHGFSNAQPQGPAQQTFAQQRQPQFQAQQQARIQSQPQIRPIPQYRPAQQPQQRNEFQSRPQPQQGSMRAAQPRFEGRPRR